MRHIVSRFLIVVATLGVLSVPVQAYAAGTPPGGLDVLGGACAAGGADSAVCQDKNPTGSNPLTGSNGLLVKVANIIAVVAGAVAVIIIIIAGFQYVTSGGDANKTQTAKNTLIYAVVGLVIIATADLIVAFVLSHV